MAEAERILLATRGARRPERRAGRACKTSSTGPIPTGPSRPEPRALADAGADGRDRRPSSRPPLVAGQRPRRLRRRRARLRDRPRGRTRRRRCPGPTSSPTPASAPWSRPPGSAFTWAENSRENRLTPVRERPRHRPHGRGALRPRRRDRRDLVAHPGPDAPRDRGRPRASSGTPPGVTRFSRVAHGLRHELDVFVDATDPVKFSLLTLTNESGRAAPPERLRLQRVGPRARRARARAPTS